MSEKECLENIQSILQEQLFVHISDLRADQALREVGVDSVTLMGLIVYLENQYDITLDELLVRYNDELYFSDIIKSIQKEMT